MKIVSGDLLQLAVEGAFDVIIHGCNCHCTMGAGIAKAIRDRFPEAWRADQQTESGDRSKLGGFTSAEVKREGKTFVVVNGYTQFDFSVDYDALRSVMAAVQREFSGRRIGYPKIGAGLGGGDWPTIEAIIDEELAGEDHTLVEFSP